MEKLNHEELNLIVESLRYTKLKFEEYEKYPSEDYRKKRIEAVQSVISKIKLLLKQ